jgi:hypothetical protein
MVSVGARKNLGHPHAALQATRRNDTFVLVSRLSEAYSVSMRCNLSPAPCEVVAAVIEAVVGGARQTPIHRFTSSPAGRGGKGDTGALPTARARVLCRFCAYLEASQDRASLGIHARRRQRQSRGVQLNVSSQRSSPSRTKALCRDVLTRISAAYFSLALCTSAMRFKVPSSTSQPFP